MNKKYLALTAIAFLLGLGMLLMPAKKTDRQTQPEQILSMLADPSRFVSVDNVTDRLIKKDPSILLVDLRSQKQFAAFSIPGAVNIPADSVLSSEASAMLASNEIDKVLYANSDALADQVWLLCKRNGLKNMYVMKGGLNEWFDAIVKTETPAETQALEYTELFNFRKAAREYFFGAKPETSSQNGEKKKLTITPKAASASSGGGC
jgi:rhodanese-related sulfurtransferase